MGAAIARRATGCGKTIVPVMLQERGKERLPDSIHDLNWLSAHPDTVQAQWLAGLERRVSQGAAQRRRADIGAMIIFGALVGWLSARSEQQEK